MQTSDTFPFGDDREALSILFLRGLEGERGTGLHFLELVYWRLPGFTRLIIAHLSYVCKVALPGEST